MKICRFCGKPFEPTSDHDLRSRYCSSSCKYKAARARAYAREQARIAGRDLPDLPSLEITPDEEVAMYITELETSAGAILEASTSARPQLRPLCYRVGSGVKEILEKEGLLDE